MAPPRPAFLAALSAALIAASWIAVLLTQAEAAKLRLHSGWVAEIAETKPLLEDTTNSDASEEDFAATETPATVGYQHAFSPPPHPPATDTGKQSDSDVSAQQESADGESACERDGESACERGEDSACEGDTEDPKHAQDFASDPVSLFIAAYDASYARRLQESEPNEYKPASADAGMYPLRIELTEAVTILDRWLTTRFFQEMADSRVEGSGRSENSETRIAVGALLRRCGHDDDPQCRHQLLTAEHRERVNRFLLDPETKAEPVGPVPPVLSCSRNTPVGTLWQDLSRRYWAVTRLARRLGVPAVPTPAQAAEPSTDVDTESDDTNQDQRAKTTPVRAGVHSLNGEWMAPDEERATLAHLLHLSGGKYGIACEKRHRFMPDPTAEHVQSGTKCFQCRNREVLKGEPCLHCPLCKTAVCGVCVRKFSERVRKKEAKAARKAAKTKHLDTLRSW